MNYDRYFVLSDIEKDKRFVGLEEAFADYDLRVNSGDEGVQIWGEYEDEEYDYEQAIRRDGSETGDVVKYRKF